MAENTKQTIPDVPTDDQETVPNRLQVFVNNHPRAAKVAAITGAVASAIGVVQVTRTIQANRKHVSQAAGHAQEALHDLSTAVSPQESDG